MKKYSLVVLIFLLPFYCFTQNNKQATYILEKVNRFHKNHPKISGKFNLIINGEKQTGIFYYLNTNNNQSVKLFFGPEDVADDNTEKYSYWVVDKNKLWVYLNESKVLVEQEIPEYFNTIGILGSGLSHYFATYQKFSMEEIEVKNKNNEQNTLNRLKFSEPIKEKTAFTEMTVDITEDGFQQFTSAVSVSGEGKQKKVTNFSFLLYEINLDADFNEKKIFKINPSGNIEILRNVLMN